MRIPKRAIAFLVAFMLVAGACQPGGSGAGTTKVRLQLKWVAQAQFAGYYAALDQGYYTAENLDLIGPLECVLDERQAPAGVGFGADMSQRPGNRSAEQRIGARSSGVTALR